VAIVVVAAVVLAAVATGAFWHIPAFRVPQAPRVLPGLTTVGQGPGAGTPKILDRRPVVGAVRYGPASSPLWQTTP